MIDDADIDAVIEDALSGASAELALADYVSDASVGLGVAPLSPAQIAVCAAIEGRDVGVLSPDVLGIFGGVRPPHGAPPREVVLLASVRSGKSVIAAARALQCSQTCDVSGMIRGEVPRVSIQSVHMDQARVIYGYICGALQGAAWRDRVVSVTADTATVLHPTDRPVEIRVTAGARAGASLVARWSAGVIFDEAPRMIGADAGVVNLTDARRAVLGRMLPGASILYVGSPWAPFGPVYDLYRDRFGAPSSDVVVIRAPGWVLHPARWTPEACEDMRRRDPDAYETDVAASFADRVISYLPSEAIDACVRSGDTEAPPRDGWRYVAAIDPATRGNAWTLGVAALDADGSRHVALARQWVGSSASPLRSDEVFTDIARVLAPYGVTHVYSDQWSYDALAVEAERHGLVLHQARSDPPAWYGALRTWLVSRQVSLPDVRALADDLRRVQRRVTQTGIAIDLPRTADGRHCDYAAMLAVLLTRPMVPPDDTAVPPAEDVIERELLREAEETEQWISDL